MASTTKAVPLLTAEMAECVIAQMQHWPYPLGHVEQRVREALLAIASGSARVVPSRPVEREREAASLRLALQYAYDGIKDAVERGLYPPYFLVANGGNGLAPIEDALAQAQPPAPPDDAVRLLREALEELLLRGPTKEALLQAHAALKERQP